MTKYILIILLATGLSKVSALPPEDSNPLISSLCVTKDIYSGPMVTVEEHEVLTLSCLKGYHIETDWALYGLQGTACIAQPSHMVVKLRCDGLRSCAIEATNHNFGDPCIGTKKKLSVIYKCHQTVLKPSDEFNYIPTPEPAK